MKKITALAIAASTSAHAGYGSMGTYEASVDGSDGSIGDMVLGALLIGVIYLVWKHFF